MSSAGVQRRTLLALLAVATLSCGKSGAPTSPGQSPTSVVVSPAKSTLDPGGSVQLSADVRDASGAPVAGPTVEWSASPPGVVSVNAGGLVTAIAAGEAIVTASSGGRTGTASITVRNVYDIDARGIPAVVTNDYIDLSKIERVSLFRSGIGHDYSDSVESCRSMKHYFMPRGNVAWNGVDIFSPVAGTVLDVRAETTFASQLQIRPAAFPAFTVILFHVTADAGVTVGASVGAGQRLGHHVGSQTMSDVAVRVETPAGTRLVSYFDAMDAATFSRYQSRGAASRQSLIISKAARDASPLSCQGEAFLTSGSLEGWFLLN